MSRTGDAVLGCCIQNFQAAMTCAYDVVQSNWWEGTDRKIWDELSAAYAFGGALDISLVKSRVKDSARVDEVVARSAEMITFGTYLAELEKERKVAMWIDVASNIVDTSNALASAQEIDEAVMRLMMKAFATDSGKDGVTSAAGAASFEEWYKSPDEDIRWPHPIEKFGHYRSGNVLTLSAYSGCGKSWQGLQYLEAACKEGAAVHYYSLEMSEVELQARLISMGSNVDTQQVEDRSVPFEVFQKRLQRLAGYDYTVFTGATGPGRIFGAIRKAKASKRALDIVIIDHVHLLDVSARHSDYRLALDKALNQFKGIAQDAGVCFILLAQMTKYGSDEKAPPKPTCRMLKETSALEQISDAVIFIHRDWANGAFLDSGHIYFGKKRNGKMPGAAKVHLTNRGFSEMRDSYVSNH